MSLTPDSTQFSIKINLFVSVLRERRDIAGNRPPDLSGSCGSYINGTFYIFAGCDDRRYTNEVLLEDGAFCGFKGAYMTFPVSVDVQLCPHRAALRVEESD